MKFSWLIPREIKFFNMLEIESEAVLKGAQYLNNLMENFVNVEETYKMITEIEHQADDLVHSIFEALNTTFITPIDREDISKLASALDDILDHIHGSMRRIFLYNIEKPPQRMIELTAVLLKSCVELNCSVRSLKNLSDPEQIESKCVEINRLENEADEINNQAVVELFKLDDAKEIMKLKEIYSYLESATDRCEDASNVISDIVIKNR